MKKGRLSKSEQLYIKQHHVSKPVDDIAAHLDRDPTSIAKYIETKLDKGRDKEEEAPYDLKTRPFWEEIKSQCKTDEQKMFVYHWKRIVGQFRDDVLPTEELQIVDAIKLEILMNRALKEQQSTMNSIDEIETLIATEKEKFIGDQDREYLINLERQVAIYRAAIEALSKDYKDLQGKKSGMLKDLKATREQRIKRLEDSKQTFTGWIKNVLQNAAFREELSINMEKMRLAVDKESARLAGYHKYDDGVIDQPLLTPETFSDD